MLKNIKLLGKLTKEAFCAEKYFIPQENGKRIFVFDKNTSSIEVVTYTRDGNPKYLHYGKVLFWNDTTFSVQFEAMINPIKETMYYEIFQTIEINTK